MCDDIISLHRINVMQKSSLLSSLDKADLIKLPEIRSIPLMDTANQSQGTFCIHRKYLCVLKSVGYRGRKLAERSILTHCMPPLFPQQFVHWQQLRECSDHKNRRSRGSVQWLKSQGCCRGFLHLFNGFVYCKKKGDHKCSGRSKPNYNWLFSFTGFCRVMQTFNIGKTSNNLNCKLPLKLLTMA